MPGGPEIAVIMLVALIVLGPQQLPKAMRTLGNAMAEIRKISSGFQSEIRNAMNSIETQASEMTAPSPVTDDQSVETGPTSDVTEVVAKNTAEVAPPPATVEHRPAVDPSERAAG